MEKAAAGKIAARRNVHGKRPGRKGEKAASTYRSPLADGLPLAQIAIAAKLPIHGELMKSWLQRECHTTRFALQRPAEQAAVGEGDARERQRTDFLARQDRFVVEIAASARSAKDFDT